MSGGRDRDKVKPESREGEKAHRRNLDLCKAIEDVGNGAGSSF